MVLLEIDGASEIGVNPSRRFIGGWWSALEDVGSPFLFCFLLFSTMQ